MTNKKDPEEVTKDLTGFEDVLDLLGPGQKQQRANTDRLKLHESFEIVTYLEQEEKRIKNITHFYEQKLEMWSEFNQNEAHIAKQQEACEKLRKSLAEVILSKDSAMLENMIFFWDQCFRNRPPTSR